MLPWFSERFGNAASRHHGLGFDAAKAVEAGREACAEVLGGDPREVVFTSGATESNNLAILGLAASASHTRRRRRIITVRTEHKAVIDPCRELETRGFDVIWLGVDRDGHLDLDELDASLNDETLLVSVMHANNETGVVHPIGDIGRRCREHGALFHTDATQAFGKLELDVERDCVDLLSFSAHKVYGPKGVGGLHVRRKRPRVRLEALQHGGGHERGLRSGTLNVPGIVGLSTAARLALEDRAFEQRELARLRDRLERALVDRVPETRVHGDSQRRLAGITNLGFAGVEGDAVMRRMPRVAASSASACTSATLQPSYVLGAMGLPEAEALGSIRFSLGRPTTEAEIDAAVTEIDAAVRAEREDPTNPAC